MASGKIYKVISKYGRMWSMTLGPRRRWKTTRNDARIPRCFPKTTHTTSIPSNNPRSRWYHVWRGRIWVEFFNIFSPARGKLTERAQDDTIFTVKTASHLRCGLVSACQGNLSRPRLYHQTPPLGGEKHRMMTSVEKKLQYDIVAILFKADLTELTLEEVRRQLTTQYPEAELYHWLDICIGSATMSETKWLSKGKQHHPWNSRNLFHCKRKM